METLLLSDLCSVCHIKAPRYKCPRCSTRTCSLECVRRHKQRAGCSGERDQTAFVSKSKLMTPAGVDHDYNFLSGLEKNIKGNNMNPGLVNPKGPRPDRRKSTHYRTPKYWELIEKFGIKVSLAPVGLSRERMNRSQVVNHGENILFTTEWIFEDGSSVMSRSEDCHTLASAYNLAQRIKSGAPKTYGVKRKREGRPNRQTGSEMINSLGDAQMHSNELESHSTGTKSSSHHIDSRIEAAEPENSQPTKSVHGSDGLNLGNKPSSEFDDPKVADTEKDSSRDHYFEIEQSEPVSALKSEVNNTSGSQSYPFIYLVKPQTFGDDRVLIPVNQQKMLRDVLSGKTILEFPTFQILQDSSIPSGFILEQDYLIKERIEQDKILAIPIDEEALIGQDNPALKVGNPSLLSTDNVWESLRRDVKTGN